MNLVTLTQDNTVITTSKTVADYFGKNHKHVMRDIETLLSYVEDVGELNIRATSYTSLQNKVLPCYEMDRDAFTLLAMGFTGSKAMKFKMEYIRQFNQMEALLKQVHGLNLQEKVSDTQAKLQIQQLEEQMLVSRIQTRLQIAKMMNQSFDINEFLTNDKANLPTQTILDMKLAMGQEIATYGTLDLATNSVSHLLEVHGIDMTAKTFNEDYLVPNGLLDQSRTVTTKGKYFGTNAIQNSKTGDTAPRWFDCRFKELLNYLNI